MDFLVQTQYQPCTVRVTISSLSICNVRMQAWDEGQANTVLTNRRIMCKEGKTDQYYIQLPISPKTLRVRLFDEQTGSDKSFNVVQIKTMGLRTNKSAMDWTNPELHQAIELGQRFCYNLGWLPTSDQLAASGDSNMYCSPDKKLLLEYLPVLTQKGGAESITPMRIGKTTSIIQVSQKLCVPFTVPGRLVMFFHEFSHKFENSNPDWELEADLNGLTIYLALGYPRIEALNVYEKVFFQARTPENAQRHKHIEEFILNFETYISN